MSSKKLKQNREKRKKRVGAKIHGTAFMPRLSVFRSSRHIYVQAINDDTGMTIEAASTLAPDIKDTCSTLKKLESAKLVGALIAKKLKFLGVEKAVFDRGMYLYHGRISALADSARESGLQF